MQTFKILATSATLLLSATGAAFAQAGHDHGAQQPGVATETSDSESGPITGDQTDMMQTMMPMMMGMHARMMNHVDRPGMAMMDRGMMQMMMGPGMMGIPSAEEATAAMRARLSEFDADGDGSLSLSEFETLHSAMIRESMVDRFQHLDADGDGAVSPSEMVAPAGRMSMRERMGAMSTDNSDN